MLIGIAGAVLAGVIGRTVGFYQAGQSAGFLMSLVGAIVMLFVDHALRRKPAA